MCFKELILNSQNFYCYAQKHITEIQIRMGGRSVNINWNRARSSLVIAGEVQ
jgi:hypothetical protein